MSQTVVNGTTYTMSEPDDHGTVVLMVVPPRQCACGALTISFRREIMGRTTCPSCRDKPVS